jgi:ElaB/YqjD/DUF883 family membrane-anchored ribosome-binding protein
MAKSSRSPQVQTAETKIEAFAEDLGRLLGTARAKADNWLSQRQQVAKALTDIRDTAAHLLTQLGDQAKTLRGKAKPKIEYAPAPVSRKKRRTMSAKARAAISAAQKARWAKQKAGKKG